MPYCCAFQCKDETRKTQNKIFYEIPDPKKGKKKVACWFHNTENASISINAFIPSKDRVICVVHFHPDCIYIRFSGFLILHMSHNFNVSVSPISLLIDRCFKIRVPPFASNK